MVFRIGGLVYVKREGFSLCLVIVLVVFFELKPLFSFKIVFIAFYV